MRFGSAFQVEDLSYWRMTRDLMDKSLDNQNIDLESILSSSTHMKEFGLLSNKMLRKVASYLPQASQMTTSTLAMYSMILYSSDMQNACSISA